MASIVDLVYNQVCVSYPRTVCSQISDITLIADEYRKTMICEVYEEGTGTEINDCLPYWHYSIQQEK